MCWSLPVHGAEGPDGHLGLSDGVRWQVYLPVIKESPCVSLRRVILLTFYTAGCQNGGEISFAQPQA